MTDWSNKNGRITSYNVCYTKLLREDTILRKKSKVVKIIDEKTQILLADMADTMYQANGVGLAAPQIGILKRLVVIDVGEGLIKLINPVIRNNFV